MADNNMIELVARLDTSESEKQIISDIETKVAPAVDAAQALKITCHIDTKNIKALQSQINELSKNLTVNVGALQSVKVESVVDTKAAKSQAKELIEAMDLKIPRAKGATAEVTKEIQKLINEYNEFAKVGNQVGADETFAKLVVYAEKFRKEIHEADNEAVEFQKHIRELAREGFTYIDDKTFSSLDADKSIKVKSILSKAFGFPSKTGGYTKDVNKGGTPWDAKLDALNKEFDRNQEFGLDTGRLRDGIDGIIDLVEYLNKSFDKGAEFVEHYGEEIDKEFSGNLRNNLEKILGIVTAVNGETLDLFDPDDENQFGDSVKKVGDSYAKAAEQTEYFRRQQELLQQDYDILTAKISKANLNIDTVATRELKDGSKVNYSDVFKSLTSTGITDTQTLKAARDAVSAIRKEFQLANAEVSSDLPQNAIENIVSKISKLDSQIKVIAVDYQKLNDVPQNLADSFEEMQKLSSGFDFSTDLSGITKDELKEKTKAYTQIKIAVNETQALLKVAQKEEAAFNREFEKELKIEERLNAAKEKAFNKEFNKALKEEEKEIAAKEKQLALAKELREEQQHDYWQGRFEETVKAQTAENQVLKDMKKYYEDLEKGIVATEKAKAKSAKEDSKLETLANRIKKLTADMNAFAVANQRAVDSTRQMSNGKSFAETWNDLQTRMSKGADLTADEVKHLREEFQIFGKEAEAAGLKGESAFGKFLDSFKTMSSYITANMVFNFVKRQIREMVNEVITIDTAMTELRKVTEATNEEFAKFAQSAGQTGRQLGASISDVIDATTTFARLGETLSDAEELGRVAILYKNVGDGITAETASEDLVSTMKAFKIEAQDAISVVDKFNEVGNSFAISSAGIGEALKRSASALAAANNDLSQSIALITTANTVAQDAVSVGQGIKTVSLRLRSTKTDLEAMGEDAEGAAENVSKLREQMLALTGIDIQLDDSTYKSTYQILLEISKVWDRLDDLTRSSVLEQLFGKRQANIGAAILENGELLESVYKTAINSAGSAMREQEEYAKSIQYSIDVFKAAFQDLAQTTVNNDFIKGLVDTATSFLEVLTKIIDKIGTLPAILGAITTVNAIRGKGKLKEYAYLHAVAICV